MGSPVPDAKERFLTVPMIAALAVCAILLAVPYRRFPNSALPGMKAASSGSFPPGTSRRITNTAGWWSHPRLHAVPRQKEDCPAPRRMDLARADPFHPGGPASGALLPRGTAPRGRGRVSPDPAGRSLVPGRTADRQAVRLPPALLLAVHSPSLFPAGHGGAANRRHGAGAPGCGPFRRGYLPARHQHPLHRRPLGRPSTSQGGAAACAP